MARVNVFGMSEKAEATSAQKKENYVKSSEVILARRCSLVAGWLYVVTLMVVVMVVIGGLTRLTNSGLSMVDWRPLTGWLPPFSVDDWMLVFGKYKTSPEYQKINAGMSLIEFKKIFWLEYIHRLWGRIIGLAFVIPFICFVACGWVNRRLTLSLLGLLILGGLQGGLGWYMVQSGLVDRPDVSQYRLAAHLALALVIIAALFWTARGLDRSCRENWELFDANSVIGLRRSAYGVLFAVFLTAVSGAFVAGLDAGLAYNTFPLMDGNWVPEGLLTMTPLSVNFFENTITVQFDHRVLALSTAILVISVWVAALRYNIPPSARFAINCLFLTVIAQVGLGITTLLLVVPLEWAAAHQVGAVFLLICAVWLLRELTPSSR